MQITAGYRKGVYGVVFRGLVQQVSWYAQGADVVTEIQCTDELKKGGEKKIVVGPYPPKTEPAQVIRDVVKHVGWVEGSIENTGILFDDWFIDAGYPNQIIKDIVEWVNGKILASMEDMKQIPEKKLKHHKVQLIEERLYHFTLVENVAYFIKGTSFAAGVAGVPYISPDSGLIEARKYDEEGKEMIHVRCFFNHMVEPDKIVVVESAYVSGGVYKVTEVRHRLNKMDFITEFEAIKV